MGGDDNERKDEENAKNNILFSIEFVGLSKAMISYFSRIYPLASDAHRFNPEESPALSLELQHSNPRISRHCFHRGETAGQIGEGKDRGMGGGEWWQECRTGGK